MGFFISKNIYKNMKVKLTESQYKLLKEFKKRAYSFDWDDNILMMPTRIHLDYSVNGLAWVPVSVSTEEFRSIRHKLGTEFRFLNDNEGEAFKDFKEYDAFISDTKEALDSRRYGPSFNKFKEALISGSDFSIITARSNPPRAIKDGIKLIIRKSFSYDEQEEMKNNLNGVTIDEYLNLQDYHPVSSEEFINKWGLDIDSTNPEEGKKIAFEDFVDRVVDRVSSYQDTDDFEGISIGFSDDDISNVEVVEKLIEEKLKQKYPDIKFLVYDTSDPDNPKKKKMIIKR